MVLGDHVRAVGRLYVHPMAIAVPNEPTKHLALAPRPADLLLCVGLFAVMIAEIFVSEIPGARWLLILCAAVQAIALIWRREFPRTVALAVVAANTLPAYFGTPSNESTTFGLIAIVVSAFALGRHGLERPEDRPRTIAALLFALLIAFASSIYQSGLRGGDFVFISIFFIAPFVFGRAISVSHRGRQDAERATIELAESSEKLRELAVRDERERIARELHDVIAHSVSLMGLQAGAARKVLPPGNEEVSGNLRSIEETGRDTLNELRRMLGVMRSSGGEDDLAPQPGLATLPGLVERHRASGVKVELEIGEGLSGLSPGVDLAAFRILQEALTNSVRHAPEAPIFIDISFGAGAITLTVESAGALPATGRRDGAGHGIVGMNERAALYGGSVEAHFIDDVGFVVRATLPAEFLHTNQPAAHA